MDKEFICHDEFPDLYSLHFFSFRWRLGGVCQLVLFLYWIYKKTTFTILGSIYWWYFCFFGVLLLSRKFCAKFRLVCVFDGLGGVCLEFCTPYHALYLMELKKGRKINLTKAPSDPGFESRSLGYERRGNSLELCKNWSLGAKSRLSLAAKNYTAKLSIIKSHNWHSENWLAKWNKCMEGYFWTKTGQVAMYITKIIFFLYCCKLIWNAVFVSFAIWNRCRKKITIQITLQNLSN